MTNTKRILTTGAFAVLAFCFLGRDALAQTIPSSVCSLPVVSTVTLEYPVGSTRTTTILKSDPEALPTVYTSKIKPDDTFDSIFVALDLSGKYEDKPLTATLNGDIQSKGRVVKVVKRAGEFAGGHHTMTAYQIYTFDAGSAGAVEAFNKEPIVLEADIGSREPKGNVYKMVGPSPILLYDRKDPTRVVAKLYHVENQVQ